MEKLDTIFEKTIDMKHNNIKAVEWQVPQIQAKKDYGDFEFQSSLEHISNDYLKTFKSYRFEAYKNWGFPKWKRTKLNGYEPEKYISFAPTAVKGKIFGINGIDEDGIEILAKYDFEGAHRKFLLMAEAFSNTGFYLKTEEGETREPIIINYYLKAPIYEMSVYNLKPFSKATVIRILRSNDQGKGFRTTSNRIIVHKNASLELVNINLNGNNDINIDNIFIELEENSKVEVIDINIGGKITAPHFIFRFSGKNSVATVNPYYLATNDNIIDMLYLMRFYAPKTSGSINGKGIIKDNSKAVFRGFLDIKRGAKDTNAAESSYTLTLSEKSKAEAIPSLTVDENEVTASHAASIGTIESDKLYYLMTRGFSKEAAKKMIAYGIFEPAVDKLNRYGEDISQEVRNVVFQRI